MTSPVTINRLTDAEHAAWDAFVDRSAEGTFFHRAGWQTVVQRSFGHATHFLFAERGGAIVGVMPIVETKSFLFGHALISNGYSVAGGPIADDEAARQALTDEALRILESSGAFYLEVRCPVRPIQGWLTRDNLYAGFSRGLPEDEAENLKQIPRKQRAVVRKAIDSALTYTIDTNVDDLWDLYAVSVRNLGTPVFGKKYFANLLKVFGPACDVLTIRSDGKPVASVLNFYFKNSVMPFYTGSMPRARRLGANDLMYWKLMRHAVAKGLNTFDFGRSKVGTGPYDFKKNWGFSPVPLIHQFMTKPGTGMPDINPTNPKYRLFIKIWRKLPLPIANRLGPLIVRNIA
ncbi:MAG: FemAB family PEP-CTERM system-associated protein [Rhodobacteraceae bacterium]|nr:FemAB family PEP-CTERM system-associated protein [Paracoccaceae bacterium]